MTRRVLIGIASLIAIGGIGATLGGRSNAGSSRKEAARADASSRVELTTRQATQRASNRKIEEGYGKVPLAFEANRGQFDAPVRFIARGAGYALFLTPTEAVLDLRRPSGGIERHDGPDRPVTTSHSAGTLEGAVVRMSLAGSNPAPAVAGVEQLPGRSNYYRPHPARAAAVRGSGPRALLDGGARQYENIPSYARVRYADVYPGVDLVYYGNQRQLEYDLVVAPGADPGVIRLAFEGVDRMEVSPQGELVLQVAGGEIRQHKPIIYQDVDGVRQSVDGGYVLTASQQAAFSVGAYDRSKPLILDPVLSYGTYLGGNAWDSAEAIAVDASGNAYVTGQTQSADFPVSAGLAPVVAGHYVLFVTKLNAAGTAMVYSTYLDDGGYDIGKGIKVDAAGNAYITGEAGPGNSALVLRLDASGAATYGVVLGNLGNNWGNGIAIDGAGNAYVTGLAAPGFDVSAGAYQTTSGGGDDAFVAKLNTNLPSDASSLVYSTFLGGSATDEGAAIAIDGSGNAYVTGKTFLGTFPVTAGAFQSTAGGGFADVFVSKLSPTGTTLLYSTYFGGSFAEYGHAIAVDASGYAYVAGDAQSSGLPTTAGAYQVAWKYGDCKVNPLDPATPCDDAFVAKFNPSASGAASLVYSTYLGSAGKDWANGLAVDSAGNAYVAGYTLSVGDFPTLNPLAGFSSSGNGFITELNAAGSALLFSTYYTDKPYGLARDASGNLYVAGVTYSTSGIATSGAYQGTNRGGLDGFIAKVSGFSASGILPTMALDRTSLAFSAASNGAAFTSATGAQTVRLTQTGTGTVTWTAASTKPWLTVSPASGTGSATLTVGVQFAAGLAASQTGSITLTFTGAGNTAGPITATLGVLSTGTTAAPFGSFDTPTDGTTGVTGSIAVTGWALDDVEVTGVRILRGAVAGEAAGTLVFIGNAVLVDGARPDVQASFPNAPRNTRAGWGYLMLTNFLPSLGNGTFTLTAIADDADGHSTTLGTKTITCTNSTAITPTGAIDTPAQGGTVSGAVTNFGWVLSPGTRRADPPGGGTVRVVVDGAFLTQVPSGWTSRADLSALFPVAQFSGINTALGVASFDSTALVNGVHTISWVVTDNSSPAQASGIGSRYFTVSNGSLYLDPAQGSTTGSTVIGGPTSVSMPRAAALRSTLAAEVDAAPGDVADIRGRHGFDLETPVQTYAFSRGRATVQSEELDRIELHLSDTPGHSYAGYLRVAGGLAPLPIGSALNASTGEFTWMPGVGFVGTYDLVFVQWSGGQAVARQDVRIVLNPQGSSRVGPQTIIDTPSSALGTAVVGRSFVLAGWAADLGSTVDRGVDTVHVWAYPATGDDPIWIGAATYGGARPDVAAVYGDRFLDTGYGITVQGLAPGTYDLAVFAYSTVRGGFVPAKTVRVTVR